MNRRDFVKRVSAFVALLTVAPRLSSATSHIRPAVPGYEALTGGDQLVKVSDIWIDGLASSSCVVRMGVWQGSDHIYQFAMNAFGGMFRHMAPLDYELFTKFEEFRWELDTPQGRTDIVEGGIVLSTLGNDRELPHPFAVKFDGSRYGRFDVDRCVSLVDTKPEL